MNTDKILAIVVWTMLVVAWLCIADWLKIFIETKTTNFFIASLGSIFGVGSIPVAYYNIKQAKRMRNK